MAFVLFTVRLYSTILISLLKSPQSVFNRNGNLRPSPPAARSLLASLPQNEPGCFEKWDIAPNGFQTPQKFIREQGIVKLGGGDVEKWDEGGGWGRECG